MDFRRSHTKMTFMRFNCCQIALVILTVPSKFQINRIMFD